MEEPRVLTTVGRGQSVNVKCFATAMSAGLLVLVLTLLSVRAATYGQNLTVAPAGIGEWTPLGGPMIEGGQVNALVVHPTIADTVYAAVAPLGAYDLGPSTIYKTTNGAVTWTPVYTAEHQVYALATTAGGTIYAGAYNLDGEGTSLYASYDSGLTWAPILTATDRGVWLDIAVHPTDPDIAIIGGWFYHQVGPDRPRYGMVYRTDDAGLTWTPILTTTFPNAEDGVLAVLIHPITPTIMLASARHWGGNDEANSYLYRSNDGGVTWPISITITNAHIQSLLGHPVDGQMLYAASGVGQWTGGAVKVFRSSDAGLSWSEVLGEAGGPLVFEPPSTVYTRWWQQIWASPANGDPGTWSYVSEIWDGGTAFDIDLGAAPPILYAGGERRGVFKNVYDSIILYRWELRNNGISSLVTPRHIGVDPQNLQKLFVAAGDGGGWISMDGGQTWAAPSGLAQWMFAFAIKPTDSSIVYGGASGCSGVVRSQDGGLNFATVYSPTHGCVGGGHENFLTLDIAQSAPTTVYAGGEDRPAGEEVHAAIVRSLDDGVSWTEVFTLPSWSRVEVVAIDPTDSNIVYAGGQDCHTGSCHGFVYRTTDGGASWDLSLVTTDTVKSIVIDYRKPNVLYVADDGYWVRKSTDSGNNWTVVRPPWWMYGNPSGNLLAIDPYLPDHVYLGGWGYIAETTDGGMTWSEWHDPINYGAPQMPPYALVVNRGKKTQTLYAGFSGVWAYSRTGPFPYEIYLPLVIRQ